MTIPRKAEKNLSGVDYIFKGCDYVMLLLLLIVLNSALTNFIKLEQLLEQELNFKNELQKACFMAFTGAILRVRGLLINDCVKAKMGRFKDNIAVFDFALNLFKLTVVCDIIHHCLLGVIFGRKRNFDKYRAVRLNLFSVNHCSYIKQLLLKVALLRVENMI